MSPGPGTIEVAMVGMQEAGVKVRLAGLSVEMQEKE